MYEKNFTMWPEGLPRDIEPSTRTIFENLERSYQECADKTALVFYETEISYRELYDSVTRQASWLHNAADIRKGDRVAIFAQNCPQYVISYYAILCAGAVVVPVNPMCTESELAYLLDNSGAKALFAATELQSAFEPVLNERDVCGVGIQYNDYLRIDTQLEVPEFVSNSAVCTSAELTPWAETLAEPCSFERPDVAMDDLVMMPYTSGSTGNPKGCMHTSLTTQHGTRSVYQWFGMDRSDVFMIVAPMFHVVGLQAGMNSAIALGCTAIILPRWDREVAAKTISDFGVTTWPAVPSMIIDLINLPGLEQYDVSSLRTVFGGGSAMPDAVAAQLKKLCDVTFLEGFGMTETCCPTTANPVDHPKSKCVGLPVFNTDVRVVDPDTLEDMAEGQVGEILISGPQVLPGYWKSEEANKESFVVLDGLRYLRSGDLGHFDDQGYLYIVDRIKRMINASGYKVWPTQVEATLHHHPAIEEVCVFGADDPKRGETVKAMVVRSNNHAEITENEIIEWSREQMAAYKIPRSVIFVDSLPKSGSGKVLWRQIQDEHNAR